MMTGPDTAVRRQPAASEERLADLPQRPRRFVGAVIALGGIVLVASAFEMKLDRPALSIQMAAFALLTSTVKLRLPLKRDVSTMSVSNALTFAAMLLLGSAPAVLLGVISAWGQCTFRMRSRNPLHRTLFSMATLAIAAFAAAHVFDWLLDAPALTGPTASRSATLADMGVLAVFRALTVSALVYFMANSLLVAAAVALTARQPIHRVWLDGYLWSAPGYFVAAVAGYGFLFVDHMSQAWGAMLAVPLYLTYRSYRSFIARIEDERAQVRLLSDVQLATIEALALAIEVKDHTSQSHIQRFQVYADGLARAMRLEDDDVRAVKTAALLHDIGNLAVPEHILGKPGVLTEEEFQRLQVHPRVGADIVGSVPFPYPVAPLILSHHEHWDGRGYPRGLAGEAIPIGARILTVVDFFTALLADRPYRRALSFGDAIATMRDHAGTTLDPSLVEQFVAILPELEQQVRETHAATLSRRQRSDRSVETAGTALEDIAGTHREAKVLYEIAQALGSSLGLDDTFGLLAEKLQSLIPYSACALFLHDEQTDSLVCRRTKGLSDAEFADIAPLRVEGASPSQPVLSQQACPTRFTDALTAPLVQGTRVIGALAVYQVGPLRYGPEERRLLDLIAQHAAAVVHNSVVFEQAQEASLTDPLTGLANRRALQQELAAEFERPAGAASRFALLLMDLDGLKYLNDTFGHHVGDRAIREVGSVLRDLLRRDDLCARYAGDEFVVALRGCDLGEAIARGKHLQEAIGAVQIDVGAGRHVPLSISVGAAAFPEDGRTQDALVSAADERMYRDKAQRKRGRRELAGRDAA
jgi:diguanylate cyclase (GGDEF)-like protein